MKKVVEKKWHRLRKRQHYEALEESQRQADNKQEYNEDKRPGQATKTKSREPNIVASGEARSEWSNKVGEIWVEQVEEIWSELKEHVTYLFPPLKIVVSNDQK